MRYIALITALFVGMQLSASHFDCGVEPPKERDQNKLVWQYTELFSAAEAANLNAKLVEFARETSNRVLVIVVDTLCGLPESDLAFEIGQKWGIGKAGFDNGIVLLIKPNGPPGQRKVYIATGYGLEAVIPDLLAKRIVDNEIIPRFKAGAYFEGVDAATDVIMGLAKGEFNEKSYGKKPFPWSLLIFGGVFALIMFFTWRKRVSSYATTNRTDFWTAMWLMSQMDRRHGGGGGFGGGGGGGGFGGFGGGGFGGGGAGGSW